MIGLVALVGVAGLVLTKIAARFESLEIGQVVEVDFLEVGPELVVHQFGRRSASEDDRMTKAWIRD